MKTIGLIMGVALALLARPAVAEDRLLEGLGVARDCAGDVERLCKGIMPGEGRIKACVKEKLSQLSPQCFDAIAVAMEADKVPPPDDSATAAKHDFTNMRAIRYCEIFFIVGSAEAGLSANFVNTSQLNNAADPKDTCPPVLWAKVTPQSLEAKYAVLAIFKNGPRVWTLDSFTNPAGEVRTFDGLQARWLGRVELPKDFGREKGATAYHPTTVHRDTVMHFDKGKPVFILEDPEGAPAVMQAMGMIVDPSLTYDDLQTLSSKLKLAEGWKYRVTVLDRDLEIHTINGEARIVQDDLGNTYDVCFETACTYRP